jgi:hypothetical protein
MSIQYTASRFQLDVGQILSSHLRSAYTGIRPGLGRNAAVTTETTMSPSTRLADWVPALAVALVCIVALLASFAARAEGAPGWRNVTAGGTLRAGVYGRIAVKGNTQPPLIYPQPVIADDAIVPRGVRPVYLYVPPGQVRKWKQSCARWSACDEPVLFVRVDHSPSRWGRWHDLREAELALHQDE